MSRRLEIGMTIFLSVVFVGSILNQLTTVVDGKVLTALLVWVGTHLAALQRDQIGHQLLALVIVWSPVVGVALLVRYVAQLQLVTQGLLHARETMSGCLRQRESELAGLRQGTESLHQKVSALEQESDHYRTGLAGYARMYLLLNSQLNKLVQTIPPNEVKQEFERLSQLLSWHLSVKLYGGNSHDKVVFLRFGGNVVVLGEEPEQVADDLPTNVMCLPIVQTALQHGAIEFEDDVQSAPGKVRVRGTNWSPSHCKSIMVVPIAVSVGGVFGVYTNTSGFFADKRELEIPTFLRAVMEIAAHKLHSAQVHHERGDLQDVKT